MIVEDLCKPRYALPVLFTLYNHHEEEKMNKRAILKAMGRGNYDALNNAMDKPSKYNMIDTLERVPDGTFAWITQKGRQAAKIILRTNDELESLLIS